MTRGIWSNSEYVSPQESYDIGYDKGWADAKEYWTPIEQDRIIKLLEGGSCGHFCRCMYNEPCDVYADAIALIKGESL